MAPNFVFRLCMDDCDDGDDDLRYQQPFCTISPFSYRTKFFYFTFLLSLTFSFFLAHSANQRENERYFHPSSSLQLTVSGFCMAGWLGINESFFLMLFTENVPHALLFPEFHKNIQFSKREEIYICKYIIKCYRKNYNRYTY